MSQAAGKAKSATGGREAKTVRGDRRPIDKVPEGQ